MNEEETKALAEEIISHLDNDGGYIQLLDGVYIQTAEDALFDTDSSQEVWAEILFSKAPYWIIAAPEMPEPIQNVDELIGFIEKYAVTDDDVDLH